MATLISRSVAVRQVLRRIYPHKAMGYAREHLQYLKLGPIRIADAAGLLETFFYSLIPREAQGVVRHLLGLNAEFCQAGPVGKSHPSGGPVKRALSKDVLSERHAKRNRGSSRATNNSQ